MFDCEITLISVEYQQDEIGDMVEIETKTNVLANKIDYRNKDYYQALTSGLKPSLTFSVNKFEYNKQKTLEYEEKPYKIIDVFSIKARYENEFETIGIMCEAVI